MGAVFASPNLRPLAMSTAWNNKTANGTTAKGYCCTECATGLLQKLAGREAREWADEEAELEAGNMDVTDLQKRRLATFGNLAVR